MRLNRFRETRWGRDVPLYHLVEVGSPGSPTNKVWYHPTLSNLQSGSHKGIVTSTGVLEKQSRGGVCDGLGWHRGSGLQWTSEVPVDWTFRCRRMDSWTGKDEFLWDTGVRPCSGLISRPVFTGLQFLRSSPGVSDSLLCTPRFLGWEEDGWLGWLYTGCVRGTPVDPTNCTGKSERREPEGRIRSEGSTFLEDLFGGHMDLGKWTPGFGVRKIYETFFGVQLYS